MERTRVVIQEHFRCNPQPEEVFPTLHLYMLVRQGKVPLPQQSAVGQARLWYKIDTQLAIALAVVAGIVDQPARSRHLLCDDLEISDVARPSINPIFAVVLAPALFILPYRAAKMIASSPRQELTRGTDAI